MRYLCCSKQDKELWQQEFSGRIARIALPNGFAKGYHFVQIEHNGKLESRQILLR